MRNLLIVLLTASAALAASPANHAVPLFFIANRGQPPPAVRFMAQGSGLTAYFSPGEARARACVPIARLKSPIPSFRRPAYLAGIWRQESCNSIPRCARLGGSRERGERSVK